MARQRTHAAQAGEAPARISATAVRCPRATSTPIVLNRNGWQVADPRGRRRCCPRRALPSPQRVLGRSAGRALRRRPGPGCWAQSPTAQTPLQADRPERGGRRPAQPLRAWLPPMQAPQQRARAGCLPSRRTCAAAISAHRSPSSHPVGAPRRSPARRARTRCHGPAAAAARTRRARPRVRAGSAPGSGPARSEAHRVDPGIEVRARRARGRTAPRPPRCRRSRRRPRRR